MFESGKSVTVLYTFSRSPPPNETQTGRNNELNYIVAPYSLKFDTLRAKNFFWRETVTNFEIPVVFSEGDKVLGLLMNEHPETVHSNH